MGVDYTGNYGIGVEVYIKELTGEYEEWSYREYVEDILSSDDYFIFETGDGNYTGHQDDLYVCIKNPFIEGFCITEKANKLIADLEFNSIEYRGKVNVVGGLYVW